MNPFIAPTKILDSLILMQIVKEGPLHGYALTLLLEEKSGWKPSQTAVYNSLKSMENDNLVTAEEKIEKGRVQKIYSITKQGRNFFKETHQNMKVQMMKNLTQLLSFVQLVGENDTRENSEEFQLKVQNISEKMKSIYFTTILLLKEAPNETEAFVEETLLSLKKIAQKYGIKIQEEDAQSKQDS